MGSLVEFPEYFLVGQRTTEEVISHGSCQFAFGAMHGERAQGTVGRRRTPFSVPLYSSAFPGTSRVRRCSALDKDGVSTTSENSCALRLFSFCANRRSPVRGITRTRVLLVRVSSPPSEQTPESCYRGTREAPARSRYLPTYSPSGLRRNPRLSCDVVLDTLFVDYDYCDVIILYGVFARGGRLSLCSAERLQDVRIERQVAQASARVGDLAM